MSTLSKLVLTCQNLSKTCQIRDWFTIQQILLWPMCLFLSICSLQKQHTVTVWVERIKMTLDQGKYLLWEFPNRKGGPYYVWVESKESTEIVMSIPVCIIVFWVFHLQTKLNRNLLSPTSHSDLKCQITFGNWFWDPIVGNGSIVLNFYQKRPVFP